jgi:glycogen synthase
MLGSDGDYLQNFQRIYMHSYGNEFSLSMVYELHTYPVFFYSPINISGLQIMRIGIYVHKLVTMVSSTKEATISICDIFQLSTCRLSTVG